MLSLPDRVQVYEVGPRDGLQNEPIALSTEVKIDLVQRLADAGLPYVEVSSFVHPKWIPQLADADAVFAGIERTDDVRYAAMVPNLRGLQRARDADVSDLVLFLSATQTHNRSNLNRSVEQSLEDVAGIIAAARGDGAWIRGCVSMAFGCPFEGDVPLAAVRRVAARLVELGVDQLELGDTSGMATPRSIGEVVDGLSDLVPPERMSLHLHNTRGTALANVLAGMDAGVRIFDASIGGLGGCPYCPGASGNVATEDLVWMLHSMDIETGIDLEALLDVAEDLEKTLRKPLLGRYLRAARGPWSGDRD
jgi:hydroxymethylglutaryl-CoA lyase